MYCNPYTRCHNVFVTITDTAGLQGNPDDRCAQKAKRQISCNSGDRRAPSSSA